MEVVCDGFKCPGQLVAAFLGGDVNSAGSDPAVLGVETTRADRHFFQVVVIDLGGRDSGQRILLREAIDKVCDFRRSTAADIEQVSGPLHHPRLQRNQFAIAANGEFLNLVPFNDAHRRGAVLDHQRALGHNDDRPHLHRFRGQHEVLIRVQVNRDLEFLDLDLLEQHEFRLRRIGLLANQRGFQRVTPDRHIENHIDAFGICSRLKIGTENRNDGPSDGFASQLVGDDTRDLAGRPGVGHDRGTETEDNRTQPQQQATETGVPEYGMEHDAYPPDAFEQEMFYSQS